MNWLCNLFGYDTEADGIFTSGVPNLISWDFCWHATLLPTRNLTGRCNNKDYRQNPIAFRILCSTVSHFTIRQAAALLGLGEQAVVMVETDANYRLCPAAVERQLAQLKQKELLPIALVATVGTTDFGSIDPLPELAACAKKHRLWLHVDAAYGGALILSDRHRHKLIDIEATGFDHYRLP